MDLDSHSKGKEKGLDWKEEPADLLTGQDFLREQLE